MYQELQKLKEDNQHQVYLIASGAGVRAQGMLWDIPGIGNTLVGAEFPYSEDTTVTLLGHKPQYSYVSLEHTVDLAISAFYKACIGDQSKKAIGVALSASVATDRPKRGERHAWVVFVTKDLACAKHFSFKDQENRLGEGNICDHLIVQAILDASTGNTSAYLNCSDMLDIMVMKYPYFKEDGTRAFHTNLPKTMCLYPGSFNPPTYAHLGIKNHMVDKHYSSGRPIFSLDIDHPFKPNLTSQEVVRRAKLLKGHDLLVLSGCKLYVEKARLFYQTDIILGADAYYRMWDPQWGVGLAQLLADFESCDTRLFVVDRGEEYLGSKPVPGTERFQNERCVRIQKTYNISSTQVRQEAGVAGQAGGGSVPTGS